jgi:hypothetical protein
MYFHLGGTRKASGRRPLSVANPAVNRGRGPTRWPTWLAVVVVGVVMVGGSDVGRSSAETTIEYENGVVSVAAAFRSQLSPVRSVTRGGAATVRCTFLDWMESAQTYRFLRRSELPLANDPLIHCWYPAGADDQGGQALPGYPRRYRPRNASRPELVTAWEATRYAADAVTLPNPTVALSPPSAQLVGVPTWLAVTSPLTTRALSAQAGPVWATVQPRLRSVVWEFGNGDSVTCTSDLARVWKPTYGRSERSACTYTFLSSAGDGLFHGRVTMRWDVLYQNNESLGAWRRWQTVSRSAPVTFTVSSLQALFD